MIPQAASRGKIDFQGFFDYADFSISEIGLKCNMRLIPSSYQGPTRRSFVIISFYAIGRYVLCEIDIHASTSMSPKKRYIQTHSSYA